MRRSVENGDSNEQPSVTAGSESTGDTPYAILVVDDNDWNRDMLVRRLEKHGYRVFEAVDGHRALELVASEPLDLLLLDIMMPGISGHEVLRQVREKHPASVLPVIMATAKGESEDVVEALDAGANDYVTKPLDFPVVLARVKAQLRNKRPAVLGAQPAAAPAELGPGVEVMGKYRIDTKIGSGNFGTVFRARHLGLDHDIALKVLLPSLGATDEAVARFQREGISACRVNHPNAVQVLDFGITEQGVPFLAMELLSGRSLAEEIKLKAPFEMARAVEILLPICDVLAEVHRSGIIHRDIKPANIFLHHGRRGETVKVLDFGIAKLAGDAAGGQHLTVEGWVLGTPAYMAPERFGNAVYDGRADVYALGVVLYQMLGGRTPFIAKSNDLMAMVMMQLQQEPPPLRSLRPELPEAVEAVVMRTLAKDPSLRPDAEQLAAELASAAGLPSRRSGTFRAVSMTRTEVMAAPTDRHAITSSAPSATPEGDLEEMSDEVVAAADAPPTALLPSAGPAAPVGDKPGSEPPVAAVAATAEAAPAASPAGAGGAVGGEAAAPRWVDWGERWLLGGATASTASTAAQAGAETAAEVADEEEPFTRSEQILLRDVGFLPPEPAFVRTPEVGSAPAPAPPVAPPAGSPVLPASGGFEMADLLLGALPLHADRTAAPPASRPRAETGLDDLLAGLLGKPPGKH